jgi:hypothetical protein
LTMATENAASLSSRYRLLDEGRRIELHHKTEVDDIPTALIAFQGRLLDEEGFLRVRVEVDDGDGKRRLVVLEVEFEDGFGLEEVLALDPKEFGLQRAGAGQWGSCIRIIDPVTVRFG